MLRKIYQNNQKKIIIPVLIVLGSLSLIINIYYSYDLSFSSQNRLAYNLSKELANLPEPILIFSKSYLKHMDEEKFKIIKSWLDKSNFSKTKISKSEDGINLVVSVKNNFIFSNYISKILTLPNTKIKSIYFNLLERYIEISLSNNNTL